MRTIIALAAVVLLGAGMAGAQQPTKSISDLPLLGQYAVSAALGKDQAIYHAQPQGTCPRSSWVTGV